MKKIKTRLFVYDDNSHYDQLQGMFDQGWTIKHITPRTNDIHYILEKEVKTRIQGRYIRDDKTTEKELLQMMINGWQNLGMKAEYDRQTKKTTYHHVFVKEVEEN